MRALLVLVVVALSACKWTTFDDISKTTWAHSVQKPGEVGSSDYAVAIVGATGSASSGGVLGVVSNIPPTYSSIDFDKSGGTKIGPNRLHLSDFSISSLSKQPVLVAGSDGTIALVNPGTATSTISVVTGSGDDPQHETITTMAAGSPPDAAAFAGTHLVTAADLLYVDFDDPAGGTHAMSCMLPERAAALAATDATVYEWSQQGNLLIYPFPACQAGPSASIVTGFTPGPGAQIHLVGPLAVLAAHGAQATASMVLAIDPVNMVTVGTPLSVDGLASSTVITVDGTSYIALGFPDRAVDGVKGGAVELHVVDMNGIHPEVAETLSDAQPQSGEKFGRALATMTYNGTEILVVGADSEVFAYYRTLLYADTRD